MIVHKTLPTSKNLDSFNVDAPLVVIFSRFGILCQFISLLTEMLGVYDFFLELFATISNISVRIAISFFLSFSIALIMEICTFALVTYVVYAFASEYSKNWKGDSLKISKIVIGTVCLVGLVSFSFIVSKKNVRFALAAKPLITKIEETKSLKDEGKYQIANIRQQFKEDEQKLINSNVESKKLSTNFYNAKIEEVKTDIKILIRKESRENQKYTTRKMLLTKKIAKIESQKAEEIKSKQDSYSSNLLILQKNRNQSIQEVKDVLGNDKGIIQKRNADLEKAHRKRNDWIGYFIELLVGALVLGFVVTRVFVCFAYISAGIKSKVFYTPQFFESSILTDLRLLIYILLTRKPHNKVRERMAIMPGLVPLKEKGAIQNLSPTLSEGIQENNTTEVNEYRNVITEIFKQNNQEQLHHLNKNGVKNNSSLENEQVVNNPINTSKYETIISPSERVIIKGFVVSPKQQETLLEQGKTPTNEPVIKTVIKEDKHTVKHINRKTMETKYYTLSQVNNFISLYKKRVVESKQKGNQKIAKSREETLNYWKAKKEELLSKR